MPINYANTVTYGSPASDGGNPWQINPTKILQVKTASATPNYGITVSGSDAYTIPLSVYTSLKRTKPNSIFYVEVTARVTGDTNWGDWEYDSSSTYYKWRRDSSWSGPGNVSRQVIWNNEEVFYQEKPYLNSYFFYPFGGTLPDRDNPDVENTTNDGGAYQYETGTIRSGWTNNSSFKAEVRRRLKKETAPKSGIGVPDIIIWASNSFSSSSGPSGSFFEFIGGPLIADGDSFNSMETGKTSEETFELSGNVQPTESEVATNNYIYLGLGIKNVPGNTGAIHLGKFCDHFNLMSMRVYEVDGDESTFIMKPDDAEFALTEGAPPTNEPVRGYGIPNHYWDSNEMFSRGIRCLIPNHTKPGEWVAFGEGYMTSDGGATGGSAVGAEVNQGYMAGMITKDNGNSWNELKGAFGSTPYTSHTKIDTFWDIDDPTYPNEPIVYDWATNGSTTNPVWIMTGKEIWGTLGMFHSSGGDIRIYRSTDFYNWEEILVPRDDTSGKNRKDQFISSVCYSDGYFVFGNHRGKVTRSENIETASAGSVSFSNWKSATYYSPYQPMWNMTSNDGGSTIVASGAGDYSMAFSTDSGNSWDLVHWGLSNRRIRLSDWSVPYPRGKSKNYLEEAQVHNITYVGDTEVYVKGVAKGPGVWIACGFKTKKQGTTGPSGSETTKFPLYAYSEDAENWYEINVQNDTNLPYNGWTSWYANGMYYRNSVRERITYCKDIKRFVTWANAGPGPSWHHNFQGQIIDGGDFSTDGNEDWYPFYPNTYDSWWQSPGNDIWGINLNNNTWDSSKASLWVSNGTSLTDWIQVSAGTPFVGAEYSGTDNAPTEGNLASGSIIGPLDGSIWNDPGDKYAARSNYNGKTGTPNVFQYSADGYMNGRYMVGSAAGSVYNSASGRVAYIDFSE